MVNKHSGVTVVFSLSSRLCFPALKVWVPVGLGHSILIVPIMAFLFMFSCLSIFFDEVSTCGPHVCPRMTPPDTFAFNAILLYGTPFE